MCAWVERRSIGFPLCPELAHNLTGLTSMRPLGIYSLICIRYLVLVLAFILHNCYFALRAKKSRPIPSFNMVSLLFPLVCTMFLAVGVATPTPAPLYNPIPLYNVRPTMTTDSGGCQDWYIPNMFFEKGYCAEFV